MSILNKAITTAWKRGTKRAPKMVRGLIESQFMIKLDGDKAKRRVYEDWTRTRERKNPSAGQRFQPPTLKVPALVIKIKNIIYDLDKQHKQVLIEAGMPKGEA